MEHTELENVGPHGKREALLLGRVAGQVAPENPGWKEVIPAGE
jgi:hypothetical protein